MRSAAIGLSLVLLALPSTLDAGARSRFAARAPSEPLKFERLPDDPTRVPNLLMQLAELKRRASAQSRDRLADNVVIWDTSFSSFTIPAAGSLAGGFGTFFRSDVTLANYSDAEQQVLILWFERGKDGLGAPVFRTMLPNGAPVTVQDFVATQLGLSGLGSLMFIAVDQNDDVSIQGSIDGFSRIWTNQPGASGTVSQPFPAMHQLNLTEEFEAIALGLRQDDNYRTNAGVVNLDSVAHTFNVIAFGEGFVGEFTIDVPALSMQQVAIPAGNYGAVTLAFTPQVDEVDFGWLAYGTSVDNRTGDGWVSNASVIWDSEDE